MLLNLKEFLRPASLKEAWDHYQANPEHTLFSSGGLSTALREDERTQVILDLSTVLPKAIEETQGYLFIGGGMTINEIINALEGHDLTQVLSKVGTNQIRNMATLSGSIAQKYGWSDILTALVAYKAQVQLYKGGEQQFVPIDDYLQSKESAVVLGVRIEQKYNFCYFQYISRTDYDVSQFNFCLCVHLEEGSIGDSGIAYGAAPGVAKRLKEAEGVLNGLRVSEIEAHLSPVLEMTDHAQLSDGFGLSGEYRKELLSVFLKRGLVALRKKG